ncbi:MAG: hypothetical protein JNM68_12095, partial [Dinghuibacter sp.]|nr:hypothetical protein [Dinghuibacter sp.]
MKKIVTFLVVLLCAYGSMAQENDKQIATRLVKEKAGAIGLSEEAVNNSVITGSYIIPGSDIRMVYLQQTHLGIPVYNKLHVLAFKNGAPVSVAGERVADAATMSRSANAVANITASAALRNAMSELKVRSLAVIPEVVPKDEQGKFRFGQLGFSIENISAELVWLPVEPTNELKLAWQVFMAPYSEEDYWLMNIDAKTGAFISKQSLTVKCNWDGEAHT